jgi:hypothetical protein
LIIDKEVLMWRTRRRFLQFESVEDKVLLSMGLAIMAKPVHQAVVNNFHLNGALVGLPLGTAVHNGFGVSMFLVQGHMNSMHRVTGFLNLVDTLILTGKKPNLNGASLELVNKEGSVVISIKQTTTRYYQFDVQSGSGSYAGAAGSGILVILTNGQSKALSFTIRLHTTAATNA